MLEAFEVDVWLGGKSGVREGATVKVMVDVCEGVLDARAVDVLLGSSVLEGVKVGVFD